MTTAWLEMYLGSERWTYTMAEELILRGHEVTIFTYLKSAMFKKIMQIPGIKSVDTIDDSYDLVLCNHNATQIQIPDKLFTITTSHGPTAEPEQPIPGADVYVAVSEEVQENLINKGFSSQLARNPIDIEIYKPERDVSETAQTAMFVTNHFGAQDPRIQATRQACEELGIDLLPIGLRFGNAQWEIWEALNMVDIVISLGRGVLEAMACGRNVIVAGSFGVDGFIDNENYIEIRKNNFSGRRYKKPLTKDIMVEELKKYDPAQGRHNRKLIEEHHDAKRIVDKYLNIYEQDNLYKV